jgi:hypothetical protein
MRLWSVLSYFLEGTLFIILLKKLKGMHSSINIQETVFLHLSYL